MDSAPANATSTIAQVEITYTAAGGWTTPAECAWGCNYDYDLVNGLCIDAQLVGCVDVAPVNATSVIADVLITFTSADGWSEPAVCEWLCDSGYMRENNECVSENCIVRVDVTADNAVSDGTSWETAFVRIQDGIDAAATAATPERICEVWVAEGEYYIYESARTNTIQMAEYVEIYGGFSGVETGRSERDWEVNETVLDGNESPAGENNVYHVVVGADNSVIDGFTIRDGHADVVGGVGSGGGMYIEECSPTVSNCVFIDNVAISGGGIAVYNDASPTIENCHFENNIAYRGGAIRHSNSANSYIKDCTFTANIATSSSALDGGGGIYSTSSLPTIESCIFKGNIADAQDGGAIYNYNGSHAIIENCLFFDNFAYSVGGGIYNYASAPTITNCTLAGNINTAIRNWNSSAAPVVTNTIIWGNTGSTIANGNGASATVTYSNIEGGWDGDGNIDADPLFVSEGRERFDLRPNSPCIDSGTSDGAPEVDLINSERWDDLGMENTGAGTPDFVDMGVYEVQTCSGIECEFGCASGRCLDCDTGDCCDDEGYFVFSETVCNDTPDRRHYCSADSTCGSAVLRTDSFQTCSGVSAACGDGEPEVSDISVEDVCLRGVCVEEGDYAFCETCELGCDAGCLDGIDLAPVAIDISLVDINPYTMEMSGDISATIERRGDLDTLIEFDVVFFEDVNANGFLDPADTVVTSESIWGEEGEAAIQIDVTVTEGYYSLFQDNLIYIFVDSADDVVETDETNNLLNSMSNCEYEPEIGNFDPVVEWSWTEGDEYPSYNKVNQVQLVAQLNDDNSDGEINYKDVPDIVFLSDNNESILPYSRGILRAASGDGSGELFAIKNPFVRNPEDEDEVAVFRRTANPAVADIDDDGKVEILVYNYSADRVLAFENDGRFKWESEIVGSSEFYHARTITVADINQDSSPEIICGKAVLDHNGKLMWDGPVDADQYDLSSDVGTYFMGIAANLDMVGDMEVIAGAVALRSDGTLYWYNPNLENALLAVGNFDEDLHPEIVAVSNGYVYMLEHDGVLKWGPIDLPPKGTLNDNGGPPTIADFDGDGEAEIGIAGGYNYVVFEGNGEVLWSSETQDISSNVTGASVFDFEGDGTAEVVYRDEEYLRIYNGSNGDKLVELPMESGTVMELPVVADVDNDGNAEIVISGNPDEELYETRGLWIFGDANDTWVNTRRIWHQHDYHITNVEDDGTIPRVETFSWLEHNSYRQNAAINAKACADLSGSLLRTESEYVNATITLTVRVGNAGAVQVGNGVPVSFYLGNPEVDGVYLGSATTSRRLWPGEFEDVSLEILSQMTGMLELYAVVDKDENGIQSVSEVNEFNNIAMTAYDLCEDGTTQECGSEVGECTTGIQYCFGGIWGACENAVLPTDELCDGLDNDCDGRADEMVVTECSTACGVGTQTCMNGAWLECSARQPEEEICDGRDNNCDGKIDETCECDDGDTRYCGTCVGQCEVGVATCTDGTWSDCEGYVGPSEEICDLIDNDCDGRVDESCICAEGTVATCSVDEGACAAGTQTCLSDGTWAECTGTLPSEELCDGVDNNCDGTVDEGLTQSCSSACETGERYCENGSWSECTARQPSAEVCDGKDNDCDGETDEELSAVPCTTACGTGMQTCENGLLSVCAVDGVPENYGEICSEGTGVCMNTGTVDCSGDCTAVAGTPQGDDVCWDGLDNNCDGYVDEFCPDDNDPPAVELLVEEGEEFDRPTDIWGTVYDEKYLDDWTLEIAESGSDEYILVASGAENVINGKLGLLDSTVFSNGMYQLRLSARDGVGHEASEEVPIFITGERKVGAFSFAFEDITIPVHGIPITVTRTYNNQDKFKGDFGVGWDMTIGSGMKVQRTRPLGMNYWAKNLNPAGFHYWVLETDMPSRIFITFPDGHQERFEADIQFQDPWSRDFVVVSFKSLGDTTSTLNLVSDYDCRLNGGNITNETGNDPLATFDPDSYALTTREGITYFISRSRGLYSVEDEGGNYISITRDYVVSNNSAQILFDRDSEDRITRIWDYHVAETNYEYDLNGDLVRFVDQSGEEWRYAYDTNHNLISAIDPRGNEVLTASYDDEGRLISTGDGFGQLTTIEHDIENLEERIHDKNGNLTRYLYNDDGDVIEEIGPDGSVSRYTYDSHHNKLSEARLAPDGSERMTAFKYIYEGADIISKTETDPLGYETTWEYDSHGRVTRETDALGHVTETEYVHGGPSRIVRYLDGTALETVNTYTGGGTLKTAMDALGNVTTYTVNNYGQQVARTDDAGHMVNYEYDNLRSKQKSREYETVTTDFGTAELETMYAYDDAGRLIRTVHPDGRESLTEYNSIGKRSASVDGDGRRTEYEYDENGNLTRTLYFDGTEESHTYDANGNKLSTTDREGNTISYEYDAMNRVVKTTFPDSTFTQTEYDVLGQVTAQVDAQGNRTEFEYDEVGRKVLERNGLGQETSYTYDAVGNVTHVTGPNGETVEYVYDDLGRKTDTLYPDGTSEVVVYDAAGRITGKTGRRGKSISYAYDGLGRLTSVTDAVGTTSYTYDERGNKLSETDAENQTTTWGYDAMGRKVRRTLPLGQAETWTYYANGNVATHTDFTGEVTAYYYDAHNRLERVEYDDGSEVSYTYDMLGRRVSMTDSRGITAYQYDIRGRVTLITNPDGSQVGYTYDANGNKLSVQTSNGTTAYTYDALNRIATVTDGSGVTVYTYDSNGKQNTVSYPNGTLADYDYDALGQLTYLENRTAGGEIISSYAYTLDDGGNRTSLVRLRQGSGGSTISTTTTYEYDDLNRLLSEQSAEALAEGGQTSSYSRAYTYDAVGNRLTMAACVDADCESTTYAYNDNNQIISETTDDVLTQYFYDANGNTIEKDVDGTVTSFAYDDQNRMITATTLDHVIHYEYDADGIRTEKTVDTETTVYLVDHQTAYPQVLEERTDSGSLIAAYTIGNDLICMNRAGVDSYYHYDGLGSTGELTDAAGLVTDTYDYEAFGEKIASTGSTQNAFLFTGEQYDPGVGFYYLRARFYNPLVGRFMTMDEWNGIIKHPLTLNKYLYAEGSPPNGTDPSGHFTLIELNISNLVQSQLRNVHARIGLAFSTGTIGTFWQQLGRYAEGVCRTILNTNPAAIIQRAPQIGNRFADFSIRVGQRMAMIEVKYSFPRTLGTAQFNRLISQLEAAVSAPNTGQVVFWTLKDPRSQAEVARVYEALGANAANVQFVHGVTGMFRWLEMYFGSWI